MGRSFALMWVVLVLPLAAQASIGTVTELQGSATRTPSGGPAVPLKTNSEIELGDTLAVNAGGNLQLTLADGSVLLVSGGSNLVIDQAHFGQLERHFSARLLLGAVWAAVTKMASGASSSFEISTPRAVAGVRGTVFRVDAAQDDTTVGVEEGEVWVQRPGAQGTVPAGGVATATPEVLRAGQALRVNRGGFRRMLIAMAFRRHAAFARFIARRRQRILQRRLRRMQRRERGVERRQNRRRQRRLRRKLRHERLNVP